MSTTAIVYEKNLMDTTSRRDGTVVNKFTTGNIGDEAQAIFDNLFLKNGYNTETHGMDIIDDPDDGTTNEFERIERGWWKDRQTGEFKNRLELI